MKEAWLKAAEQMCGWTKKTARLCETWQWNEIAKAIAEKKRKYYKTWHKMAKDTNNNKEARRNTR